MERPFRRARIRIGIVDIHPIFRDALKHLLGAEPDFTVVAEGQTGADALRIASLERPHVLLLDAAPPKVDALAVLARFPHGATRVVLLASRLGEWEIVRALELGARGVVLKGSTTRALIDGIRAVASGRYAVGSDVMDDLDHALSRMRRPAGRPCGLTARELEVSTAVAAGATNQEVARALSISVQTVKHHLTKIYDKTGVSSRLQLMVLAVSDERLAGGAPGRSHKKNREGVRA